MLDPTSMNGIESDKFTDEKLKNFKFDMSKGPRPNIDLIPPPRWSHVTIPYNYS